MNAPPAQPHGLLSIGEFSRRSRLSPRALRLYERQGLLLPAVVDDHNGYRYYEVTQIDTARLIATLRRLDMPLSQVAEVVRSPRERGAQLVAAYWRAVERRNDAQRELAQHVEARLAGVSAGLSARTAGTRAVPAQTFITEQHHVTIPDLRDCVQDVVPRLLAIAEASSARAGHPTFLYHGEVTEDSDGPVEFCVPVEPGAAAEAALATRTEPPHKEVYVRLSKADLQYPRVLDAYDAVFAWADQQNKHYAGPPREIYLGHYPDAAPDVEICDVALPFAEAPQRPHGQIL
jgi:DNA-binding transcriptional MerR regulator